MSSSDVAAALEFASEAEAGGGLVKIMPALRADHPPFGGAKEQAGR